MGIPGGGVLMMVTSARVVSLRNFTLNGQLFFSTCVASLVVSGFVLSHSTHGWLGYHSSYFHFILLGGDGFPPSGICGWEQMGTRLDLFGCALKPDDVVYNNVYFIFYAHAATFANIHKP